MRVHNFKDDLARSDANAGDPWWEVFYRKVFPEYQSMSYNFGDNPQGLVLQSQGVDRSVALSGGKVVLIEEKIRYIPKRPDVLLERWSDVDHNVPGWIVKDLHCDYIAYVWWEAKEGLLLPFQQLRMAWRRHGKEWMKRYPQKDAPNRGYKTRNYPIPTSILLDAIRDEMRVSEYASHVSANRTSEPPNRAGEVQLPLKTR